MEVLTYVNANYADGQKVLKWLEKQGHDFYMGRHHPMQRRVTEWRSGGLATLPVVDRLLVHFGRHISELPDDVWIPRPY